MSETKKRLIERAKLAEQVERYDDMAAAMKKVVELTPVLSEEERNLLAVAYQKVIERRLVAWRILNGIVQKTEACGERQQMAKEYCEKVESELKSIVADVLMSIRPYARSARVAAPKYVQPYISLAKRRRISKKSLQEKSVSACDRYDAEATLQAAATIDYLPGVRDSADAETSADASFAEESSSSSLADSFEDLTASSETEDSARPLLERYAEGLKIIQLTCNLTDVSVAKILALMARLFPAEQLPATLHLWKKQVTASTYIEKVENCCSKCGAGLATDYLCENETCRHATVPCKQLNCGYGYLSITSQLKRICKEYLPSMRAHARQTASHRVFDLVNSERYKLLNPSNPDANRVFWLNLIVHVDAAPLRSSLSFTPVQIVPCELPPALRQSFRCTAVASVFIGRRGISHEKLLASFLDELAELEEHGFVCGNDRIKARILFVLTDMVERSKILNMVRFNGANSCTFCKIPGVYSRETKSRLFAGEGPFEDRDADHFAEHYNDVVPQLAQGSTEMGFRAGSMPLPAIIPLLPWSCPLDCMHLIYEGTWKYLLTRVAFKRPPPLPVVTSSDEEGSSSPPAPKQRKRFMSSASVKKADSLIGQVRWPQSVTRPVSALSNCKSWKAQEFRHSMCLLPIFIRLISNADAINCLAAYCSGIFLLSGDSLLPADIDKSRRLLQGFHASLTAVFGEAALRMNAHSHLHLADQAEQYGPLWSQTAFAFESHLFNLAQKVKGPRGYLDQLTRKFSETAALDVDLAPKKETATAIVDEFVVGSLKPLVLSRFEVAALREHPSFQHSLDDLVGPSKIRQSYVSWASAAASRLTNSGERNVCYRTQLGERNFGEILNFILHGGKIYATVARYVLSNRALRDYLPVPSEPSLLELYEDELYGKEFIEAFHCEARPVVDVVRVSKFLSKCLCIPSMLDSQSKPRKLFVMQWHRHCEHD